MHLISRVIHLHNILGSSLIPSACRKRWLKRKSRKSETPSFSKCGMIKKCLPFQRPQVLSLDYSPTPAMVTSQWAINSRTGRKTKKQQQTNNKQTINKQINTCTVYWQISFVLLLQKCKRGVGLGISYPVFV